MEQQISNSELLRVAYDDELLRKELRRQSGKLWPQILSAMKSGSEHPSAKVAVEWIKQIVDESKDLIASMLAKQDLGEYPIHVNGFDQLCSIWAPDFGTSGPFLSHEDAINFAQDLWSEFLTNDEVTLYRFPSSRFADKAAMARARIEIKNKSLERYSLLHHEYSRVGDDRYLRHPRRQSEKGPPISGSQLAESLVPQTGKINDELLGQLKATGWDQLILKIERVAKRRIKKYRVEEAKKNASFTKAVVAFFDHFLGGRDNTDSKLLEAAALAWVWRDFDLTEDHPEYEDRIGVIQRYARQKQFEALNAYINAKKTIK